MVYLRVFGGLSFREIGDICGRTETWARVTFYRTKEKLRNGVFAGAGTTGAWRSGTARRRPCTRRRTGAEIRALADYYFRSFEELFETRALE